MKMKKLLLSTLMLGAFATSTLAQIPNYVPTSGLVGWWPFNGNANDESGNGNNGTVNGPTLTSDRFGASNSAYNFNGSGNISVPDANSLSLTSKQYSFSFWANFNTGANATTDGCILGKRASTSGPYEYYFAKIRANHPTNPNIFIPYIWDLGGTCGPYSSNVIGGMPLMGENIWEHFVVTADGVTCNIYKNGVVFFTSTDNGSCNLGNTSGNLLFGEGGGWNNTQYMNGKLDDIGIWNRALTQQEVTDLYNSQNCANNLAISPTSYSLTTGSTAIFTASTSDPSPSFVWQSDFGQGFQTLNNYGNYSGVNTNALSIANVQLSEHNQPVRVISTSGNCTDTSNVAHILITDTCINTVNDTNFVTVTDTLLINTTVTALSPPNNVNTIKIYPNPASDHISIHYGNFSMMSGYQLKIENSLGQQVFQTNITQQSDYLDLSTWGGNGVYFVRIIDNLGNTIDIRKIVLQ